MGYETLKDCFMNFYSPHITTALCSSVAEPEVIKSKLLEKIWGGFCCAWVFFPKSHIILTRCTVHFVWLLFGGDIYSRAACIPLGMPWIRRDSRVSGIFLSALWHS